MTTTVAQRKRTKGWTKPPNSVCVTRPGPWGNPFKVGEGSWTTIVDGGEPHAWVGPDRYPLIAVAHSRFIETNAQAVAKFEWWLRVDRDPRAVWIREHVRELRGKTLLCWCDGPPCHAYVLAEMADAS